MKGGVSPSFFLTDVGVTQFPPLAVSQFPLIEHKISLLPAVVDGQGKRGAHKRNHAY
jgi:hypothetical protein